MCLFGLGIVHFGKMGDARVGHKGLRRPAWAQTACLLLARRRWPDDLRCLPNPRTGRPQDVVGGSANRILPSVQRHPVRDLRGAQSYATSSGGGSRMRWSSKSSLYSLRTCTRKSKGRPAQWTSPNPRGPDHCGSFRDPPWSKAADGEQDRRKNQSREPRRQQASATPPALTTISGVYPRLPWTRCPPGLELYRNVRHGHAPSSDATCVAPRGQTKLDDGALT